MKAIIEQFYETKNFPSELCTIQNPREDSVMDSDAVFECILYNSKYPGRYVVELCNPYLAKDHLNTNGGKDMFGWSSLHFDSWHDHFENNVHGDDQVVIAWRKQVIRDGTLGFEQDFTLAFEISQSEHRHADLQGLESPAGDLYLEKLESIENVLTSIYQLLHHRML